MQVYNFFLHQCISYILIVLFFLQLFINLSQYQQIIQGLIFLQLLIIVLGLLVCMGLCYSSEHEFYNKISQIKQKINFEDQQLKRLINQSFQQLRVERSQCCQKNLIKFSVQPNKTNVYIENKSFYIEKYNRQNSFSSGVIFYNDCVYLGCFRNNIPHGQGKTFNKDGEIDQKGIWNEGVFFSGQIFRFPESNILKLEILPNLRYKISFKDRSSYEGQGEVTREGRFFKHGQGVFKNPTQGYQYNGCWNFNKRQGKGKMTISNTKFEGEFKNDLKHKGILTVQNKYEYNGQWKLVQGQGQIKQLFTGRLKNIQKQETKNVIQNRIVESP